MAAVHEYFRSAHCFSVHHSRPGTQQVLVGHAGNAVDWSVIGKKTLWGGQNNIEVSLPAPPELKQVLR